MSKADYTDPRWQKKRLEILERDGWQCVACGSKDKTLNVHHLMYNGKPWITPGPYLQTLCEDCHASLGKHPKAGIGYAWTHEYHPEIDMKCLCITVLHCPVCGNSDASDFVDLAKCPSCGFDVNNLFNGDLPEYAAFSWFASHSEYMNETLWGYNG